MFYGGNVAATLTTEDAFLGWNWTFWNSVLKLVVQQLGDHSPLAPALVVPNSPLPIGLSGAAAPDLDFCAREAPPCLFILAGKREGSTASVTFTNLPAWAATGEGMTSRCLPMQCRSGSTPLPHPLARHRSRPQESFRSQPGPTTSPLTGSTCARTRLPASRPPCSGTNCASAPHGRR